MELSHWSLIEIIHASSPCFRLTNETIPWVSIFATCRTLTLDLAVIRHCIAGVIPLRHQISFICNFCWCVFGGKFSLSLFYFICLNIIMSNIYSPFHIAIVEKDNIFYPSAANWTSTLSNCWRSATSPIAIYKIYFFCKG